jgi:protein-S-isoprenylcysteine O-methyltransferase Ste14
MSLRKLRRVPLYIAAVLLVVFARPTLPGTIVGLVLIALGEAVRLWAAGHLQKNEVLTVTGPYAYVKNPLYIGTILIAAGYCIFADNVYLLALCMFMFCFHYIPYKKQVEGDRLRERFGADYDAYDRQVSDYIPRLTPYSSHRAPWSFRSCIENSEEGILFINLIAIALIFSRPYWDRLW